MPQVRVAAHQPTKRIGTPGISLASVIALLAGPDSLVAVSPEVRDNPWLRRVAPMVAKVATPFVRPVGVHVEELLLVKPDLVVTWTGSDQLTRALDQVEIPSLSVGYATSDELAQAVLAMGRALGPDGLRKAEDFLQYYRRNLRWVDEALTSAPGLPWPRVYYASIDPLQTEGRGSMVDSWITAAGGHNVAAEAIVRDGRVSFEQVVRWAPDVIVALEASARTAILEDPRWQTLTAVREGLVMQNPRGINAWCTRAAETALQVLWAAKLFHPGLLAEVDLRREVRDFHQRFYGYLLTEGDIDRMLSGALPERS
jgi:iron complex transport system substrate-binding protein